MSYSFIYSVTKTNWIFMGSIRLRIEDMIACTNSFTVCIYKWECVNLLDAVSYYY